MTYWEATVLVPIAQMNVLRLNLLPLTIFKVAGGSRGRLHMATPSRQPCGTVRHPAAHQASPQVQDIPSLHRRGR